MQSFIDFLPYKTQYTWRCHQIKFFLHGWPFTVGSVIDTMRKKKDRIFSC